jgi:hypothetical protein
MIASRKPVAGTGVHLHVAGTGSDPNRLTG